VYLKSSDGVRLKATTHKNWKEIRKNILYELLTHSVIRDWGMANTIAKV
jgi:hypothetical protein